MRTKIIFGIVSCFLITVVLVTCPTAFLHLPAGVRHFLNLLVAPKDLYEPVVTDEFFFHDVGASKTYSLNPKYLDIYELGFLSGDQNIPSNYQFEGVVSAKFFYKNKLVLEAEITSVVSAWYAKNDMKHYRKISLLNFELPLKGKYRKDISLRLTVIEPDQETKSLADSLRLYIAVSATP